jgi:hypothetical protein
VASRASVGLGGTTFVVVEVTNAGMGPGCFIAATGAVLDGPMGELDALGGYVDGSVGVLNAVQTTTCLASGERGWFLMIEMVEWGDVDTVRFSITTGSHDPANPRPRLIPQSYGYSQDNVLTVEFENEGIWDGLIEPSSFSTYVLFDGNDAPLSWGFVTDDVMPVDQNIAVAEQGSISDAWVLFHGSADAVLTMIDFVDPVEPYSARPPAPTTVVGMVTAHRLRHARELARMKRALAGHANAL